MGNTATIPIVPTKIEREKKYMTEILTLVCTSVITFLVYEGMRTLFEKLKGKKGNKR